MENVNVEEEVTVVDTVDGVEEQQKSQINIKCILLVALASVALAFHVVYIILYLLGAVQFYGQPLHLINAVKLFLDLFSISYATVYRTLSGVGACALYFVFLGFGIKYLVLSIKSFIPQMKAGLRVDVSEKAGLLFTTVDRNFYFFNSVCIIVVLSNLPADSAITGMMIFMMVFAGLLFVARGVVRNLCKRDDATVDYLLLDAFKDAAVFAAICLMIGLLNRTMFKDFIYGADALFNGNVLSVEGGAVSSLYALYDSIIEPVLFVAIAGIFIRLMCGYLRDDAIYNPYFLNKIIRPLLIVTAVALVGNLIFKYLIVIGSSSFSGTVFTDWLGTIKFSYIPIVMTEVILFIASRLQMPHKPKAKN